MKIWIRNYVNFGGKVGNGRYMNFDGIRSRGNCYRLTEMLAISIKHSSNALQTETPCIRGLPGTGF